MDVRLECCSCGCPIPLHADLSPLQCPFCGGADVRAEQPPHR